MPTLCYMCGTEATCTEHFPPRSFYPDDPSLKLNRITAKSCDEHNTEKTLDDDYMRHIFTMRMGGHVSFAKPHGSKFIRDLETNSRAKRDIESCFEVRQMKVDDAWVPALGIAIDMRRFHRWTSCAANLIYFKHFGQKWGLDVVTQSDILTFDSPYYEEIDATIKGIAEKRLETFSGLEKFGRNPDVFFYQLNMLPYDLTMRLRLFDSADVWAFFMGCDTSKLQASEWVKHVRFTPST